MGQRGADTAERSRRGAERLHRTIAQDAASASGSRLVQLVLVGPGEERPRTAAVAAPGLPARAAAEVAARLASAPFTDVVAPQREGAEGARPRTTVRVAPSDPDLALLLRAVPGLLHDAVVPLHAPRGRVGALRFVVEGRPDARRLRALRALAREVAGRLEAEALRREGRQRALAAGREARAVTELRQAKETLVALNLAGTHLMVETDEAAIFAVICRELLRLGFHSAVLAAERAASGPRPPYRFAGSSFSAPLQRATERVLGRGLAELRIDPRRAPIVRRATEGRIAVRSERARDAARQIFGVDDRQTRKLERLLGLRHVVVAPLHYASGVAALLVVAAGRLRRGDPEAIDAFALQASIALEKARLFGALRAQQAGLESEVQRRTRELTLAVQALEELDRRKDNFLANVSHELRTPLVTVLGYTDLVLSGKLGELGPRQRDCMRVVQTSGRRLRSFIDELLEYSRYELTKEGLDFAAFDVREALAQASLAAAPRFSERRLRLRARVARRTPLAWGDRERVQQVLMNLVVNAERHCRDGGRVLLAAAPVAGRIEISVTDDGVGIAPEHLERIFDRLYQVGDAVQAHDQGAGLGLGLAIAKSIVEAHGGAIGVRSRVGRGTRFRFSLAAAPPAAREALVVTDEAEARSAPIH